MAATCLTINLKNIVENWHQFVSKAEGAVSDRLKMAEVACVLKADAYGLGAARVGQALWQAGCKTFFVAHGFEGAALRDVLPQAKIIVFHGALAGEEEQFKTCELIPVLNSFSTLERWAKFSTDSGYCAAVLHVDTGMNRLGFKRDEFKELCSHPGLLDALDVQLIISHLACADDSENSNNKQQQILFNELMALRPASIAGVPLSLANSAGMMLGPDYVYDMGRVGIGLYGGNPFSDLENPMKAVVKLETEILHINEVAVGEGVSYGATWKAERPSRIATLGVGYADGFLRAGGGFIVGSDGPGGQVALGNQIVPIVGRVTMDLFMVDITDIPEEEVFVGAMVEILGDVITIDDVAERSGTISYEVLTALGQRYQRKYIGGDFS